ncbi:MULTISPECIES: porin [Caballeronia]|uniref:Porin n=1 Tax=Caballeronia zhejiangensis TaxID=871203 RepID=A0A656QBF8_9BURK|nr:MULTISPECIES: porin [Caballeronia]EKS71811.1 outer membrane protein [Burkholderia sp. SJ98]KDR25320.1 porin [Caballeronia zhejiangensis]
MGRLDSSAGRSLLGGALFFLCGLAQAKSSVTLYGVLDSGFLYTNKTLNSATGQNGGKQFSLIDAGLLASRFGIMGTEDLGGGLKLNFDLESGISAVNGGFSDSNGNLFGRQAWVALDGRFGEVKAGLQYSPFYLAIYETDPRAFWQFGSGVVNYADNVLATGTFSANAVSYTSPVFGGFSGSVMFALGGEAGNFQAGRQYSASLKYDNGALLINAAIFGSNSGGTGQTPVPSTLEFEGRTLGAAYRFGTLSAKASFVNYKVAGSFNNNVYGGGLDYLVLPQLDVNGGVWVTSDRNDTKNHSVVVALGAEYFVSKRTGVYAQVGVANNHGAMNTGLSIQGALYGAPGTTTGVLLGVSHKF